MMPEREQEERKKLQQNGNFQPGILLQLNSSVNYSLLNLNALASIRGNDQAKGGGLFGALGSVKDAIRDKLTPHPTRDETGATEGKRVAADAERTQVEMLDDQEETPAGATASTLKEADQISGQTFNDVGRIDEEGVTRVRLVRKEKM